jgi:hypothetical protein
MNGWLKLHRQLLYWEWYSCMKTTRVFIHLLLTASWKDARWQGVEIPRGSVFASPETLAVATGLSRQQVRTIITRLKSTSEITTKSTSKGTLITLCNFDNYNSDEDEINQRPNQQLNLDLTSDQPAFNQRLTTSKEGKKDKKVRKEEDTPLAPKGEWVPSENQIRVSNWFHRRPSTKWSGKELKAWSLVDQSAESLALLESYYCATIAQDDYRRRDLLTLLNNWTGEMDRARQFLSKAGSAKSASIKPHWLPANWKEIAVSMFGTAAKGYKSHTEVPRTEQHAFYQVCIGERELNDTVDPSHDSLFALKSEMSVRTAETV